MTLGDLLDLLVSAAAPEARAAAVAGQDGAPGTDGGVTVATTTHDGLFLSASQDGANGAPGADGTAGTTAAPALAAAEAPVDWNGIAAQVQQNFAETGTWW